VRGHGCSVGGENTGGCRRRPQHLLSTSVRSYLVTHTLLECVQVTSLRWRCGHWSAHLLQGITKADGADESVTPGDAVSRASSSPCVISADRAAVEGRIQALTIGCATKEQRRRRLVVVVSLPQTPFRRGSSLGRAAASQRPTAEDRPQQTQSQQLHKHEERLDVRVGVGVSALSQDQCMCIPVEAVSSAQSHGAQSL
jgi:hypothetical protein